MKIKFIATLPPMALVLGAFLLSSCLPLNDNAGESRPFIDRTPQTTVTPVEISRPTRPDGLFKIKPNYCLCKEGSPFMALPSNYCTNTCADISAHGDPTVIVMGEVEVANEEIGQQYEYFKGSLNNFCNAALNEYDKNPGCMGRLTEMHKGGPEYDAPINILEGNRFRLELTDHIGEGRAYSFRIRASSEYTVELEEEEGGGEEVIELEGHSNFIQFKAVLPPRTQDFGGPLKVSMAKRYQCLFRTGYNNDFDHVFRMNYTFNPVSSPDPLPPTEVFALCHNREQLGFPDRPENPRFGEEIAFHVWDQNDSRFYRSPDSQSSQIDINEFIRVRLMEKHNIPTPSENWFFDLSLPDVPGISDTHQPTEKLVGFVLRSFTGENDTPICPGEADLIRSPSDKKFRPEFDVLGEFIGATEALYTALRMPRQTDPVNRVSADTFLYVSQSQLENIWFYLKDGKDPTPLNVGDDNFTNLISNNKVLFYWPPHPAASKTPPMVKLDHQEKYQILSLLEIKRKIAPGSVDDNDAATAPLTDRRFGCIPKGPLNL